MDEEMLNDLVSSFTTAALGELEIRTKGWPTNFESNEVHEVVGALLSRQTTLAIQLAESPSIWNGHAAPIILRAMADVHITLAWILKEPTTRARKFIHFGLGQSKLALDHRKTRLDAENPDPKELAIIESLEHWINSQRFTWLTEVNTGSWSEMSTRRMAEEADCLDFYTFVYSPFSECAHSTWPHLDFHNLRKCENPLHRYHRVPAILEAPLDLNYLYLAGKYLQKTLGVFDLEMKTTGLTPSAFEALCTKLSGGEDAQEKGESPDLGSSVG